MKLTPGSSPGVANHKGDGMATTLTELKRILCGSTSTLTGVSISNADPSVLTKVSNAATIDDGLKVGDIVIVNSGTNATTGKYIVESIVKNTSVTLDRQAASGACTDGNITYPAAQGILQDSTYTSNIATNINEAVKAIAGGILMPPGTYHAGRFSPPLPELLDTDTVSTATDAAYKTMPSDYQRNLFMVADESGYRIPPPIGAGYENSFALFLKQALQKDLSQAGAVTRVCLKGNDLYYQGIPSASYDLAVHFYRVPTDLSAGGDEVEGIPAHLQTRLIKHYVCKEIFGEGLEDGDDSIGAGEKFHTRKFYQAMDELISFIGIDAKPEYVGDGYDYGDAGICD